MLIKELKIYPLFRRIFFDQVSNQFFNISLLKRAAKPIRSWVPVICLPA